MFNFWRNPAALTFTSSPTHVAACFNTTGKKGGKKRRTYLNKNSRLRQELSFQKGEKKKIPL